MSAVPIGGKVDFTISAQKGLPARSMLDLGDGLVHIMDQNEYTYQHTYTRVGIYTASLRTYNHIGWSSTVHTQAVKVWPYVPEFVIFTNTPIIFPDGKVEFKVDILDSPNMVSCPDLVLHWNFGDNATSTRVTAAPDLTKLRPHYEVHFLRSVDVGDIQTTLTISSLTGYGQRTLTTPLHMEETVSNVTVTIWYGETYLEAGADEIVFKATIASGSNVRYNMSYGDGSYKEKDFSSVTYYAKSFPQSFTHTYLTPGHYVPQLCAWNLVSQECANLSQTLFVQNRITSLIVTGYNPIIAIPPGTIEVTINNLDDPTPTDITCDWEISMQTAKIAYTHDWQDLQYSYKKAFILDWTFIGTFDINVTCYNRLGSVRQIKQAQGIQRIEGVSWSLSQYSAQTHQPLQLVLSVHIGSHIKVTLDFGNTTNTSLSFQDVLGWRYPLTYSFSYTKFGNYTMKLLLKNEVSEVSIAENRSIHIFDKIQNLTTFPLNIGSSKTETVTFRTALAAGAPIQHDVTVSWSLNQTPLKTMFVYAVTERSPVDVVFHLTGWCCGEHTMSIKYFNPVETIEQEVAFTLEEPVEGVDVHVSHFTVSSYIPLTVNISVKAGSHLKFFIDFGDSQNSRFNYTLMKDGAGSPSQYHPQGIRLYVSPDDQQQAALDVRPGAWGKSTGEWTGRVRWVQTHHTFLLPGQYLVSAEVSNELGKIEKNAKSSIKVQNPVDCFNASSEQVVPTPPGKAHFEVRLCSTLVPTDAVCKWYHGDTLLKSHPFTPVDDSPVEVTVDLGLTSVGHMDVDVLCSNEVSQSLRRTKIQMEETIKDLKVETNKNTSYSLMEEIIMTITMERGSNVTIQIIFNDTDVREFPYEVPLLMVTSAYSSAGTYNVSVKAWNTFSTFFAYYIVKVQAIISNLNLDGPYTVPIPPSNTTVRIEGTQYLKDVYFHWQISKVIENADSVSLIDQKDSDIRNISFICPTVGSFEMRLSATNDISNASTSTTIGCFEVIQGARVTVSAPGLVVKSGLMLIPLESEVEFLVSHTHGSSVVYHWILGTKKLGEVKTKRFTVKLQSPGVKQIEVTLNNRVSEEKVNVTLEVLESVSIDSLTALSRPVRGRPLEMVLKMKKLGTRSCIIVSAEDTEQLAIGNTCSGNSTPITTPDLRFTFNITFQTEGMKTIMVNASNEVSADQGTFRFSVNTYECYPPEINIQAGSKDPSRPQTVRKTRDLVFKSSSVTNCSGPSQVVYAWSLEAAGTPDTVPLGNTIVNQSVFILPKERMSIGSYNVTLIAQMDAMFGTVARDMAYIKVAESPLVVVILGGSQRTIGWGQLLDLDVQNTTYDPDDTASGLSDIRMSWRCRKEGNITTEEADPSLEVDFSGCGELMYTKVSDGLVTVNTSSFVIRERYIFTLRGGKGKRHSTFHQEVLVLSGHPATIIIRLVLIV